jgi:ABC-type Zn uptake system ZnuABC Zn-binding protein ZnuA
MNQQQQTAQDPLPECDDDDDDDHVWNDVANAVA